MDVPFTKGYIISTISYCYYTVNVITFNLAQSDHIKRLLLYNQTSKFNSNFFTLASFQFHNSFAICWILNFGTSTSLSIIRMKVMITQTYPAGCSNTHSTRSCLCLVDPWGLSWISQPLFYVNCPKKLDSLSNKNKKFPFVKWYRF